MSELMNEEARWVCAIVACASPMAEPHRPGCPYADTGNFLTPETVRMLSAPRCDTCGDTRRVDWAPFQQRDSEDDQQSCPDCSHLPPAKPAAATDPASVPGRDGLEGK